MATKKQAPKGDAAPKATKAPATKSAAAKAPAKAAPAKAPAKAAPAKSAPAKAAAAAKAPAKAAPAKAPAKSAAKAAPAKAAPAKAAASASPKRDDVSAAKTSVKTTTRKNGEAGDTVTGKAGAKTAAKSTAGKGKGASATVEPAAGAGLDAAFLEQQRLALLEERERYLRSAVRLQAEAEALVEGREPGDVQFDEESGEGDTIAVERERDLALSAQARQAVIEIDAALARIEDGTYGICQVSGLPIPPERLEAIPWARERVEYKAGGIGRR
ncbi:MAG: TraR/DksA C4-type zinc finger protein [Acidimicrobiales bacterium]|nr:TraR/DksA C4-type zinc finger protein [Acidimicrobiales bacterium]